MSGTNNKTEFAICPSCKKQIEVNLSEQVAFCEHCGKPFSVNDAIKLYKDDVKRSNAAKMPSGAGEITTKFNLIVQQDYKLAKIYLEDVIKKEYPSDCAQTLILHIDVDKSHSNSRFLQLREWDYDAICSLNPYIAKMYYKIICGYVNDECREWYNRSFSGELAFLKYNLQYILGDSCFDSLNGVISSLDRAASYSNYLDINPAEESFKRAIEKWRTIERNIKSQMTRCGKEFDDDFIDFIVSSIKQWASSSQELYPWNPKYKYSYKHDKYICEIFSYCKSDDVKGISVSNLISMLEKFLSPNRKEIQRRELEDMLRISHENQKKLEYYKECDFWFKYKNLLMSDKAKEALQMLEERFADRSLKPYEELNKFKKGLFKIKYCYAPEMIDTEKLAREWVGK